MAMINRVGLDGYMTKLRVELLGGDVTLLESRMICMISSAADSAMMSPKTKITDLLDKFFAENTVSISTMFAMLHQIRNQYRSADNYLKVAFQYPIQEGGGKPAKYAAALESQLMKNRMRSFVSVSLPFRRKIVVRITVDIYPDTMVHIEELVSLANELYNAKEHRRVDRLVSDIGVRLDQYERVQDYLVLGNQEQNKLGFVAQKWKGVPGGLKPMPGLERSVPDI